MAKEKVEKPQSLEKTLYAAADKLIGAVMPHDYMKMVLGLIFLKYVFFYDQIHSRLDICLSYIVPWVIYAY